MSTYVITGPAGSGIIGINGAAARLISPGDLVIIINYAQVSTEVAASLEPSVVFVDDDNKMIIRGNDPAEVPAGHGLIRGDSVSVAGVPG